MYESTTIDFRPLARFPSTFIPSESGTKFVQFLTYGDWVMKPTYSDPIPATPMFDVNVVEVVDAIAIRVPS